MNTEPEKILRSVFKDSITAKEEFLSGDNPGKAAKAAEMIVRCIEAGKKVLIFGNGGSAADSQHMAAELVVKFEKNRKAAAAIALTTDTSILTAMANDYSFDDIFSRQIASLGNEGDVAIAISTSGTSRNVLKGAEEAKKKGLSVISLTGRDGGSLAEASDISVIVGVSNTARIQEIHVTVIHALCKIIEDSVYG